MSSKNTANTMTGYMPVRLFTGINCIEQNKEMLKSLGSSCLIATGAHSAKACGALADAAKALDDCGIFWKVFNEIGPNPRFTDCRRAADLAIEMKADFIMGIGGGSPLDAAKCIAVLAANPEMTQEEMYSLKWPAKPLPIVAVGTTAGTGSEVTMVSVITTQQGRKKSFHHEDIYPAVSFGDPKYTLNMPYTVTASTAIDAFCHCMESYFSRLANIQSKCYAVSGIKILLPLLKKIDTIRQLQDSMVPNPSAAAMNRSDSAVSGLDSAVSGPDFAVSGSIFLVSASDSTAAADFCSDSDFICELSTEDREKLYNASIFGGLAINKTGTCMPHSMGYLLTEQHGLPHGYACAKYLKIFYEYTKGVEPALVQQFLSDMNMTEEDERGMFETLEGLLSVCPLHISEEEIEKEHGRWVGNGSIAKGWGNISPEMCDNILRKLV